MPLEIIAQLQSWTKVLGTVVQHLQISVNSGYPRKEVQPF